MKIRIVSSKVEIYTLNPNEEIVHLAFRPSNKDIISLLLKCPQVKALHVPISYKRTISNSTVMFLKMKGVKLLEGDVWGHRKDINEYYEVPQQFFESLKQLRKDEMPEQDIIEKLSRETRLCPDLASFIVKSS